jgi:hypothetical protein
MTREKKGRTAGQTVIRVASCRTMGGCAHCKHADDVRGFFLFFFLFLSTPTKTSACELQDKTSSVPGHFAQSSPQSPPSHASARMQPPSVPLTPPSWMGLCNVPWQLLCPVQLVDEKRGENCHSFRLIPTGIPRAVTVGWWACADIREPSADQLLLLVSQATTHPDRLRASSVIDRSSHQHQHSYMQ